VRATGMTMDPATAGELGCPGAWCGYRACLFREAHAVPHHARGRQGAGSLSGSLGSISLAGRYGDFIFYLLFHVTERAEFLVCGIPGLGVVCAIPRASIRIISHNARMRMGMYD
jgi:hypothetical protein